MTDTTNLATCRDCGNTVSLNARACPQCGAPWPARADWNGTGYEYKSQATLFGLPLVHIAFGRSRDGRLRTAKGILAIGQFARGVIVIAQFGVGIVTICQFGVGIVAIGQFIAGVAVIGQFALALYAIAQLCVAAIWGRGQIAITP